MPRINLLPAKRIAQVEELARELRWAGILSASLLAAMGLHAMAQASYYTIRQDELAQVQLEAGALQDKVQQIETIRGDLSAVGKKLAVIEALRMNKQGPSRLLGNLAEVLGEHRRVWLTHLDQTDDAVKLTGGAMAQEDISRFQLALSNRTALFESVTLMLVSVGKNESDRTLEWNMGAKLTALAPPAAPK